MVGSSSGASPPKGHLRAPAGPLSSPATAGGRLWRRGLPLLFWWRQRDALALHLVDDGFGAFVPVGGELRSPAGEHFELLTELDCLLHGRFLQLSLVCERVAVVDRVARLKGHQHEKRPDDERDRQPPASQRRIAGAAPGHHHGAFPGAAGPVFSAGPLVEGTGSPAALIVIPLSASRSRSLSSLLLTAAAASARISASLMRPNWMLWLMNCCRRLTSAC